LEEAPRAAVLRAVSLGMPRRGRVPAFVRGAVVGWIEFPRADLAAILAETLSARSKRHRQTWK